MAESELFVSGIGISKDVVSTIVSLAARRVEGVASVGGNDIASSLISVFTSRTVSPEKAVESSVEDDKLHVTVHLAVFYGYPFTKLAAVVREEVARAVAEQVGVEVSAVDVCIDSLVFPKE
ncbi:Asp23/Gls24 family envelope stress response protein [Thermophilibacter sp.]